MRQEPEWCGPRQAAKRLGISVDEVLELVETGELPAVTYTANNRLLVRPDSLSRMVLEARRQAARPE
jgi:excisionase family DNA binding protein